MKVPYQTYFLALFTLVIAANADAGLNDCGEGSLTAKAVSQVATPRIDGSQMIFHRIESGSFKMGEVGFQRPVTITKPFYMSATETTQIMWSKIAQLANSKAIFSAAIDPFPSNFKGDLRPVEKVSFEDVQFWIKRLNSMSQAGETSLVDIIPDHQPGDVYRLPTSAEWEFVIRGRGANNFTYHFGDDENQVKDYDWWFVYSGGQTQNVAMLKPLLIDGMAFYDMHGGVEEWVSDWYEDRTAGGIDPKGPATGLSRTVRGGNWRMLDPFHLRSCSSGPRRPNGGAYFLGFRLLREGR